VWISIEQSVVVSGIVYVFLGLWFGIGHVQLSLLIIGIDNFRLFNYLSDFSGNWLKGVYISRYLIVSTYLVISNAWNC